MSEEKRKDSLVGKALEALDHGWTESIKYADGAVFREGEEGQQQQEQQEQQPSGERKESLVTRALEAFEHGWEESVKYESGQALMKDNKDQSSAQTTVEAADKGEVRGTGPSSQ